MEPIVSVITTTHNIVENGELEDFERQILMMRLQTYKNLEVIVIDKASTDSTISVLEKYKNKGYLKYYCENDEGKFDAYNKGIKYANGKYIAFLSCDDFFHDITGIFDTVKVLEEENADYSYSISFCIHQQDFVFLYIPSIYNVFQVMPCPRQCMLFKKSVLEQEKGFDTEFRYMADYDLMIRLVMKKYKGILVNRNYTTYKLGKHLFEAPIVGNSEAKRIFIKNYSDLYSLNDTTLEEMVTVSRFPNELLEKLSTYFPADEKETFMGRCAQMYELRSKVNEGTKE